MQRNITCIKAIYTCRIYIYSIYLYGWCTHCTECISCNRLRRIMYYIYYIHIRFRALEFLPTFSRVLIQQANNHKNVIKLYNPIWLNDDFAFLSLGCKVRATRKKTKNKLNSSGWICENSVRWCAVSLNGFHVFCRMMNWLRDVIYKDDRMQLAAIAALYSCHNSMQRLKYKTMKN